MSDFFGNKTQQSNQSSFSIFNILMFVIAIVLILGIVAFWWFRPKATNVTVMGPYVLLGDDGTPHPNSIVTVFDQAQINRSLGNNFTLSCFVYMDDVNRERIPIGGPEGDFRFKPFLYILGVGDVLLDPIHQVARVRIKPLTREAVMHPELVAEIDIDNFMIARWNELTITITGRTVDVYMNGSLAKSTLLDNVPLLNPVGILLETSPDFSGQAGLFQAWPSRLTESQISTNYARNTDTRGKPRIPDTGFTVKDFLKNLSDKICSFGWCGFNFATGPLEYIEYEYA